MCARHEAGGGAFEITDEAGGAGSWLGGGSTMLFVKSSDGGAALVTAYLAREPEAPPLELEIRRVDPDGDGAMAAFGPADAAALPPLDDAAAGCCRRCDRIAVIGAARRRRAYSRPRRCPLCRRALVGRLGPGLWIEAFTIASPDATAAAAIEYKGLSASGSETPWLGCGSTCGATGTGMPLIGFAVRQKAAGGERAVRLRIYRLFPVRSGRRARCATAHRAARRDDNDPLEGMQLRITPAARPRRRGAIRPTSGASYRGSSAEDGAAAQTPSISWSASASGSWSTVVRRISGFSGGS